MCSSWDNLIFPGSWAKEGLVISLLAIAKGCQHGGKAVTPCGPAMQQQMYPQHRGRGNIWVDVCWVMDHGLGPWYCSGPGLCLVEERGIKISLESPWNTALESVPSSQGSSTNPAVLCPWASPSPCTTWFPDPKELGCFPCSPPCESWLAWEGGTRKGCAAFLACFHVL